MVEMCVKAILLDSLTGNLWTNQEHFWWIGLAGKFRGRTEQKKKAERPQTKRNTQKKLLAQ